MLTDMETRLTPDQLKDAGRFLWGSDRWHVALARMVDLPPSVIGRMAYGRQPIPQSVIDTIVRSLESRVAGASRRLTVIREQAHG